MSYYIGEGAVIRGKVTLGEDVGIWFNATVRGDIAEVRIGDRTNIQDNAVVHVDFDLPAIIGSGVTVGHGAIIHGCTIGDDTLIGMGAIVLNGAQIGKNCIIGAGALVTQNKQIPDGSMVYGNPAKVVRQITAGERDGILFNASCYVDEAREELQLVQTS